MQFTLGQTFTNPPSTDVVKPFVGIGTNLWNDKTQTNAYNADDDGMTGIYFDYMLSGADASMVVRLEVYANYFTTAGEVFYIDLPYTGDRSLERRKRSMEQTGASFLAGYNPDHISI